MRRVCPVTMVELEKLNPVSYLPTNEHGGVNELICFNYRNHKLKIMVIDYWPSFEICKRQEISPYT